MRRSKAPSLLNKKRKLSNFREGEGECSDPDNEPYVWGSRSKRRYENKRIFNVLWREISTKKHKTWKGDGTLEVNVFLKAVLKDETGKYIGCSTKLKESDLLPDSQVVIGEKEIEIQDEIIDEDQLEELQRRRVENRNWLKEECTPSDDNAEGKKTPKGSFKFKPILVLNPRKATPNIKLKLNEANGNVDFQFQSNMFKHESDGCTSNIKTSNFNEFICFLMPSELQKILFEKVLEYCFPKEHSLDLDKIQSFDVYQILKQICNHPSLINHIIPTNKLIPYLISYLPDWTEMGPFDSSKLEFVQNFLNNLTKLDKQICLIFAENSNVLNMLQSLCDFMNINCLQLNCNPLSKIDTRNIIEFCSSENNASQVILLNSLEMLSAFNFSTYCKQIIIFEQISTNFDIREIDYCRNIAIYTLVTAFSIEELLLFDMYKNYKNIPNLLNELVNISDTKTDSCYFHTMIGCNCFKCTDNNDRPNNIFIKNWYHFKSPFDVQLLKACLLENSSENVVSIFCNKFSDL